VPVWRGNGGEARAIRIRAGGLYHRRVPAPVTRAADVRAPAVGLWVAAVAVSAGLLTLAIPTGADPDLWGHVRFGQDTWQDGPGARVDPYAFTSDRPWINHEWLAEAVMAAAYDAGGPAGLVVCKWLLVAIATAVAAWRLLATATPLSLAAFALCVLTGVLPLAQTFRPHTFSASLMAVAIFVLAAAETRPRRAWWLAPLFAVWANVHGGWLVGLGTVAAWAAGRFAGGGATPREALKVGLPVAVAATATLATPYGDGLWRFLADTVGFGRPDIPEWWPLERQPVLFIPWTVTSIAAVASAARAGRASTGMAAAAALLALASLRVGRVVPFYSLVVTLGLVPLALDARTSLAPRRTLVRARIAVVAIGAAIALAVEGARGGPSACLTPAPPFSLDAAAARFIAHHQLEGRLVVWFDWGQYVIWHHGPRLRVSMDGRRETVFSQAFRDRHEAFNRGEDSGAAFLAQLGPHYLWLPDALPVTTRLPSWGFTPIFRGADSAVWARSDDTRRYSTPTALPGRSCFPGPT
jgi:hypothetical protein